MLCQFSVKNFQCIKDELTLDMQATNITENNETLLIDEDNEKFLPLCVIYGPNGAGKSTVLHALYSLACKIMRPICAISLNSENCLRSTDGVIIQPFKFSKETLTEPTEYEMFFRSHLYEYQYSLSILKDKIMHETLYKKSIKGSRYSLVFDRRKAKELQLRGTFKNYSYADISDNLTLLSYLGITHSRNTIIKDIVSWFNNKFDFVNYGDPQDDSTIPIVESKAIKNLMLKMMHEMDIDITDYRIEKKSKEIRVFTTHTLNGQKYELNLYEESNGTIKIFGILPYIANSITKGSTLVVDELDAKLHPLLLKYIIDLFNNPSINRKNSQLIFTSHDLSTMNTENFRRDEIWFVAKDDNQGARMYSLVEFKKEDGSSERKDARYDKHYLQGRYGADPYLRRLIDWGNI